MNRTNNTAILAISPKGMETALLIGRELGNCTIYSLEDHPQAVKTPSFSDTVAEAFGSRRNLVIIGAMGICVRLIAPYIEDKHSDPAVVCVNSTGTCIIPVLSGHVGGANDLARRIAGITGGFAAVTTQSDNQDLWALDTLGRKYGWKEEYSNAPLNSIISLFVNGKRTAVLLESRDKGTSMLERTLPENAEIFYCKNDIDEKKYELLIAVTPYRHETSLPAIWYRPQVARLGFGCRKQCPADGIPQYIETEMEKAGISPLSVASVCTIDLKKDEPLTGALSAHFGNIPADIYTAEQLKDITVPNPSDKAYEVTGVYGVAEGCALKRSSCGELRIEKHKGMLSEGGNFTFAVAIDKESLRKGHIEIVGAGPGDPELVSVRGKHFLQQADLILYAGSLVPVELTYYAKNGATVRSSASMDLEEQFSLMKEFYDRGLLVVRLHTGDPCIYGAIQEQMAYFDRYGMSYHITPGISAFQAAAAALRSQFTIPEKVQTIILTRGEGRTPMPEKEQLHKLAQSQSTMCIYLSAGIAEQVQQELLMAYPPETPVAVCYKLTWKEEKIYRGELRNLAAIVREHNLTLTTLLVVGDAIDNREGLSRLYANEFKHLFRK